MTQDVERLAIKVEEAARLLSISRAQAYELCSDRTPPAKRIPHIRVGNSIRVPLRRLEAWIEEQASEGAA